MVRWSGVMGVWQKRSSVVCVHYGIEKGGNVVFFSSLSLSLLFFSFFFYYVHASPSLPPSLLQVLYHHIHSVERQSLTTKGYPLVIETKTFRQLCMIIPRESDCHDIMETITSFSQPG